MQKHITKDPKTGELRCSCFKRCGGCQLDKPYSEQLEFKQQKAERMLGGFCRVEPIIGMDDPYHYRNKVQTAFARDGRGRLLSGVFQSSSGRVVATEDCMLEDEHCTAAVLTAKRLMTSMKILPYDPQTGRGHVRHILTRYSRTTGQLMLCICAVSPVLPSKRSFVNALVKAHPELASVVLNVSAAQLPLMLGNRNIVLYGKGFIEDEILGRRFCVSPESFGQVNSVMTEKLYSAAIEAADLRPDDTLVDAYCGTGTIGIICADRAGQVIGAELNPSACKDAAANARLNSVNNIRFVNEDAGRFLESFASEGGRPDVVILDPPRAGSDKRFLDTLCRLAPERVVYISCKIETLQRDLRHLTRSGYRVTRIQPVDMFPHTTGIETVASLSHK